MKLPMAKTYLVAIAGAIYVGLYSMGHIPVDEKTHEMILGLLGLSGLATVRHAIAKAEETKSDGADDPAKPK